MKLEIHNCILLRDMAIFPWKFGKKGYAQLMWTLTVLNYHSIKLISIHGAAHKTKQHKTIFPKIRSFFLMSLEPAMCHMCVLVTNLYTLIRRYASWATQCSTILSLSEYVPISNVVKIYFNNIKIRNFLWKSLRIS